LGFTFWAVKTHHIYLMTMEFMCLRLYLIPLPIVLAIWPRVIKSYQYINYCFSIVNANFKLCIYTFFIFMLMNLIFQMLITNLPFRFCENVTNLNSTWRKMPKSVF
ncbi:hypothetical protein T06_14372, partial [Trichinella sp. T6]